MSEQHSQASLDKYNKYFSGVCSAFSTWGIEDLRSAMQKRESPRTGTYRLPFTLQYDRLMIIGLENSDIYGFDYRPQLLAFVRQWEPSIQSVRVYCANESHNCYVAVQFS